MSCPERPPYISHDLNDPCSMNSQPTAEQIAVYDRMIEEFRPRRRMLAEDIFKTIAAAGKTVNEFIQDLAAGPPTIRPGDRCPACDRGVFFIRTSRLVGKVRMQTLKCSECFITLKHIVIADSPRRGKTMNCFNCPTPGCPGDDWIVIRTDPISAEKGGGIRRIRRCSRCQALIETFEYESFPKVKPRSCRLPLSCYFQIRH